MTIPDEAVEAAARAQYELSARRSWARINPAYREKWISAARAALEAAAPHLMAQAWDEGSVAGWVESGLPHSWNAENSLIKSNPYRSAK